VTRLASNALVHVNSVIEVNEIRNVVDPDPFNGTIFAKTGAHRLERGTVCPHLLVAIHADLCRWNSGKGGSLYRCVAIAAVNAQATDMMLVAERNRLIARYELIADVRCANHTSPSPCNNDDDE